MKPRLMRLVRPIVDRFPQLASTYRYFRDSHQLYEQHQRSFAGFRFAGSQLMIDGQFEPEETRVIQGILPSVDTLINIGANIGYYCCVALAQGKKVIAFEPVHLNVQQLLRNVRANGWDRSIEIHPIALGNRVGAIELYGGGTAASLVKGWANIPHEYVNLVPCNTLDNVVGSRLQGSRCLIIVDIEGAEEQMLEGAIAVLSMHPKPVWMVEISISEHQPGGATINPNLLATFRRFWASGYEAWTAVSQTRLISPQEVEDIARNGKDTLGLHNFLFVERGMEAEIHEAHPEDDSPADLTGVGRK